jgi:hypothetical protein
VLNTVNHPLPFASQAIFVAVRLAVEIVAGMPHYLEVMRDSAMLMQQARQVCLRLEQSVGLLASVQPVDLVDGSETCRRHAPQFIVAFCNLVIAVLLPLQLTYWYERHAKAAYVEAAVLRGLRPGLRLEPAVRPAAVAVYAIAWLAAAWWASWLYAAAVGLVL